MNDDVKKFCSIDVKNVSERTKKALSFFLGYLAWPISVTDPDFP